MAKRHRLGYRRHMFYVYEYWRPDTDVCFYVGKGHGKRAWEFRRRHHCGNIIKKLRHLGLVVDVRIVADGLTEKAALDLEIERIAMWRRNGVRLSNITDGGEGVRGLKHSEATRAVIREKRKHQPPVKHSEESRRKIGASNSIALKGRKNPEHSARMIGRTLSEEHRAAIGKGMTGRIPSAEHRIKTGNSNRGKVRTLDTRLALSAAHAGKTRSPEHRENNRKAQLKRWAAVSDADRAAHRVATIMGKRKTKIEGALDA